MKIISSVLTIAVLLSGCDEIKEKLHMLPNQDEQECLNSERLNFKDPDVLFVANLGGRGLGAKPNQYWVRYKAKNSYGAYLQGNMACRKDANTGKWIKDKSEMAMAELIVHSALLAQSADRMKKDNESYKAGKISLDDVKYKNESAVYTSIQQELNSIIYVSADSLAQYAEPKK